MNRSAMLIATLGPIGYLPASGTIATIVSLPLVYALHAVCSADVALIIVSMIVLISWKIINRALRGMGSHRHDPSEIVLDELIGCLVTFMGISLTSTSVLLGVILFRAFDISKIGLVGWAEQFSGASGILADDIVAGLAANIILHCVL